MTAQSQSISLSVSPVFIKALCNHSHILKVLNYILVYTCFVVTRGCTIFCGQFINLDLNHPIVSNSMLGNNSNDFFCSLKLLKLASYSLMAILKGSVQRTSPVSIMKTLLHRTACLFVHTTLVSCWCDIMSNSLKHLIRGLECS